MFIIEKGGECEHPLTEWVIDQYGTQFECGCCHKLMGDLEPGKPGWADRLIALLNAWKARDRAIIEGMEWKR